MITDVHCHIFPEKIAQKASDSIGGFYGVKMAYNGTENELIPNLKAAGITRALVHSVASTAKQVETINNYIAESVKVNSELFTGFLTLHPDYEKIGEETERSVKMGLKGIKIHPDMQKFAIDDKQAYPIYEAAVAFNIPIQVHTGDKRYNYSNPARMAKVMRDFPKLKVIGAHFGGYSEWESAMEVYKGLDILVDTSSTFWAVSPEKTVRLIRFFGVERVMFGTDYPMWDAKTEVEKLIALPLTDGEKEKILWQNAKEQLNIF